jgi:hypothetical protein
MRGLPGSGKSTRAGQHAATAGLRSAVALDVNAILTPACIFHQ